MRSLSRRDFLAASAAAAGAALLPRFSTAADSDELFKISLAQWSLHRAFFGQKGAPTSPEPAPEHRQA